MRTIKVDATNSTNAFLRELYRENRASENLCLVANEQTAGRGQKGATWESEKGKNLTFSMLFAHVDLKAKHQFKLSALTGLATLEGLEKFKIHNLKLKWPNDILAGNFKIGGVLIENFLKGDQINASIIGIGLNVNQKKFPDLPKAASLKMLLKKRVGLQALLETLTVSIENKLLCLDQFSMQEVLDGYHQKLFGIHKVSTFELPSGERFSGILKGVDEQGQLLVLREGLGVKSYEIKEVKLLY